MSQGPREHPDTSLALALGVLGLAGAVLVLPLVASPLAMFLGGRAVRQIDAAAGTFTGRSKARAAYLLGVVGSLLLGALVVVLLLLVAMSAIDVLNG